ncbi:transporter substrate-binding domain-containing protein [Dasania marina]|uniref:substrate-binding periplasmic protein n=1 Tax=Dasania marina TaxID=471499 RepID=UPI0030DD71A2|tara:strand:- start:50439 stop:51224 length:786 start_codon:yes stop_codon:yes gene_type:complete
MKTILCLTVYLSLSFSSFADAELKRINFATDTWPPYLVGNHQGQINQGVLVEIIYEIFARIPDVEAKIHTMPWSRAIVEVRAGRMDALPGVIYTEPRSHYLQYSDALFTSVSKLVYSSQQFPNNFHWRSKRDFAGLKIAAVRDYAMYDKLVTILGDSSEEVIVPVLSDDILIKMVGGNRVELGAIDVLTALYLADMYGLANKIKFAEPAITEHSYYLAISKQSTKVALISTINKVIAELKNEGVISAILERHRIALRTLRD